MHKVKLIEFCFENKWKALYSMSHTQRILHKCECNRSEIHTNNSNSLNAKYMDYTQQWSEWMFICFVCGMFLSWNFDYYFNAETDILSCVNACKNNQHCTNNLNTSDAVVEYSFRSYTINSLICMYYGVTC